MVPWAHPSPQPKRHLDRFRHFAQLTAVSLHSTMGRQFPPSKLPLSTGASAPHLIRDSLGARESKTQTVSRSVQPSLQGSRLSDQPTDRQANRPRHWVCNVAAASTYVGPRVTGQLADTPTRGLPTRGLDNSRTGQLADAAGSSSLVLIT